MDKIFLLARLYDCYGALLTPHQRQIVAQYVDENCSLAEIAERENITRQAVRDSLRRAEEQMKVYETALGLADKTLRQRQLGEKLLQKSVGLSADLAADIQEMISIWEDDNGV